MAHQNIYMSENTKVPRHSFVSLHYCLLSFNNCYIWFGLNCFQPWFSPLTNWQLLKVCARKKNLEAELATLSKSSERRRSSGDGSREDVLLPATPPLRSSPTTMMVCLRLLPPPPPPIASPTFLSYCPWSSPPCTGMYQEIVQLLMRRRERHTHNDRHSIHV